MKKLLVLLLLFSCAYAEFQLQNLDVSVKMNENGDAGVTEKIDLIIFTDYSYQLYQTGFNNNNLASWQQITNISEIRTHISSNYCDGVEKAIVMPQPAQRSLSRSDVWYASIVISYDAKPHYDNNGSLIGGTGLFIMQKTKPRTVQYTLNENAFNFQRTESGNIVLGPETQLTITPPQNALLISVNPLTADLRSAAPPIASRPLVWKGLTLTQFSVVYTMEQTLDKEVLQFFSDFQESIRSSLMSTDGMAALLIVLIIAGAYFYLNISRR